MNGIEIPWYHVAKIRYAFMPTCQLNFNLISEISIHDE